MKYYLFLLCLNSSLAFSQVKKGKLQLADNAVLIWETKTFDEKEHTLQTCGSGQETYICTIDDKPWYGHDMGMDMPKNQLTKLILVLGGKYIYLEISGMFNPNFSGELGLNQLKFEKTGDEYMLYAFFSDGAGTYTAHWRIVGNAAVREVISSDEAYFEWQK